MKRRLFVAIALVCLALTALGQTTGTVTSIVITGNKNITKEAILSNIKTKVGSAFDATVLEQDKSAVEKLGFFQAVDVRSRAIDATSYEVTIEVSEFPIIKEIRVVGNASIKTADIETSLARSGVKIGQVFNLNTAKTAATAIRELYTSRGFFANLDQFSPLVDSPGTLQVGIVELTINTIQVKGNTRTRKSVLERLIKSRPGEAFNGQKWQKDLIRIHNTQWFEDIKNSEVMSEEGVGKIDLSLAVKEGRTGQFNVGLQVDPRSSFAGFIKVGDTNFRGTGQEVGVTFLEATSGEGASVDLSYGNPFIDHRDTSLNVQLYSHLQYRFGGSFGSFGSSSASGPLNTPYNERRTGGALALSRPVGQDFYGTVGLRLEDITTQNLIAGIHNGVIQQDGTLGVLTLAATRNRRDLDLDPSRGDWFRLGIEPGYSDIAQAGGLFPDPQLLGANIFLRGTLEYRRYWSPGPARTIKDIEAPRRVLALRVKYGAVTGKIPFYEQFFAGGADTVRGYDEDRFWGKQTFLSSLEFRYPIQKAFNAILFVDYGGAWGGYGSINNYIQTDSWSLHLGYGVGFSFRTPFGPIRLDFGFGEDGKSRTHFIIGTSF